MSLITVKCYVPDSDRTFTCDFYEDICIGELIRNCSVNLGIDPDTIAGITRNVQVYLETDENSYSLWKYDPDLNISSILSLLQERWYKNCNYVNLVFREQF